MTLTLRTGNSRRALWSEHDLVGKPVSTFPDHALTAQGEEIAGKFIGAQAA
jgi:hypothetical protein